LEFQLKDLILLKNGKETTEELKGSRVSPNHQAIRKVSFSTQTVKVKVRLVVVLEDANATIFEHSSDDFCVAGGWTA